MKPDFHPPLEERLDMSRAEPVTDALQSSPGRHRRRTRWPTRPVKTGFGGLAFGPLVAMHPHLGRVGEVATDLDETRPEVGVEDIEVVDRRPPVALFDANTFALGSRVGRW